MSGELGPFSRKQRREQAQNAVLGYLWRFVRAVSAGDGNRPKYAKGCKFIRQSRSVEFYIGYLRQQKNINYLAPMLAGAIKGEVRSLGKDVCEMLFKLAVEMGIISNITAAVNEISDDSLENLRLNVAQEVAGTNGILTFEDADEWQNGGN